MGGSVEDPRISLKNQIDLINGEIKLLKKKIL